MYNDVFKNKKVVVTGHTGFKGSWLCLWLSLLGAKVHGVSADVPTNPSNFVASGISDITSNYSIDVNDKHALRSTILDIENENNLE